MNGLAIKTERIFNEVSKLDCLTPYLLVGGTALSLMLNHRNSEDLDFMRWRSSKDERMEVEWYTIEKQLSRVGDIQKRDILDIDHVEFIVSDVKFSFYACDKYSPVKSPMMFHNNIVLSDMQGIMSSKMETLMRRSAFRDYYDIYSMLKSGLDIDYSIIAATAYSGHRLSSKNLTSILTNGDRFQKEKDFSELNPIYDIDSKQIENYIKDCLSKRIEFNKAIAKDDFAALMRLSENGYTPSPGTLKSLEGSVSAKAMIAIREIFGLPGDTPGVSGIRLAHNDGDGPRVELDKGLNI